MMPVNSVVALVIMQTVIILQKLHTVYSAVPPLPCGSEQCHPESVCRHVVKCPTCPVEPRCVPNTHLGPDVDRQCLHQRYSEVILIEDPHNVGFLNRLKCSSDQADCPNESVCVDGGSDRGVCCKGQQHEAENTEKPGTCPESVNSCSGWFCDRDEDCPGAQKCCNGCISTCVEPVKSG